MPKKQHRIFGLKSLQIIFTGAILWKICLLTKHQPNSDKIPGYIKISQINYKHLKIEFPFEIINKEWGDYITVKIENWIEGQDFTYKIEPNPESNKALEVLLTYRQKKFTSKKLTTIINYPNTSKIYSEYSLTYIDNLTQTNFLIYSTIFLENFVQKFTICAIRFGSQLILPNLVLGLIISRYIWIFYTQTQLVLCPINYNSIMIQIQGAVIPDNSTNYSQKVWLYLLGISDDKLAQYFMYEFDQTSKIFHITKSYILDYEGIILVFITKIVLLKFWISHRSLYIKQDNQKYSEITQCKKIQIWIENKSLQLVLSTFHVNFLGIVIYTFSMLKNYYNSSPILHIFNYEIQNFHKLIQILFMAFDLLICMSDLILCLYFEWVLYTLILQDNKKKKEEQNDMLEKLSSLTSHSKIRNLIPLNWRRQNLEKLFGICKTNSSKLFNTYDIYTNIAGMIMALITQTLQAYPLFVIITNLIILVMISFFSIKTLFYADIKIYQKLMNVIVKICLVKIQIWFLIFYLDEIGSISIRYSVYTVFSYVAQLSITIPIILEVVNLTAVVQKFFYNFVNFFVVNRGNLKSKIRFKYQTFFDIDESGGYFADESNPELPCDNQVNQITKKNQQGAKRDESDISENIITHFSTNPNLKASTYHIHIGKPKVKFSNMSSNSELVLQTPDNSGPSLIVPSIETQLNAKENFTPSINCLDKQRLDIHMDQDNQSSHVNSVIKETKYVTKRYSITKSGDNLPTINIIKPDDKDNEGDTLNEIQDNIDKDKKNSQFDLYIKSQMKKKASL